uniref:methylated diphthine methylhydrolase n=1 Tax=Glossina brevipalpis TaxID=37001 RepID=A0A1A9WMZ9_9MUSC
MLEIAALHTLDTEYCADSIEWCSHPLYNNYFVCGTYQLVEGSNDNVQLTSSSPHCPRKGRIYLYEFNKDANFVKEVHCLETAAILDMKWLPEFNQHQPILAAANALGEIEIFQLIETNLEKISSLKLNPTYDNLLVLSIDWNTKISLQNYDHETKYLLASDSRGDISLLSFTYEGGLQKINSWSAHSFEAWICAFDKWNENYVYTGGDDTFLHVYDIRTQTRVLLNKSHMAGVTCLLSHPKNEHLLLTGSYDEHLRAFDTRSMKQPLGEINVKGGIWRLKSDPLDRNLILTACMYHNFSIIEIDQPHNPTIVGEFNEHNSICYGADWCLNAHHEDKQLYIATCSFYDHKLCIASVREKQN